MLLLGDKAVIEIERGIEFAFQDAAIQATHHVFGHPSGFEHEHTFARIQAELMLGGRAEFVDRNKVQFFAGFGEGFPSRNDPVIGQYLGLFDDVGHGMALSTQQGGMIAMVSIGYI